MILSRILVNDGTRATAVLVPLLLITEDLTGPWLIRPGYTRYNLGIKSYTF